MAGHSNGDQFFDDDDLDALPHDALAELENKALLTQHQTQATITLSNRPSSEYGDDFDDDDLDDAEVFDESKVVLDQPPAQPFIGGEVTQREQFRQARYGGSNNVNSITDRSVSQRGFGGVVPSASKQARPEVFAHQPSQVVSFENGRNGAVDDLQRQVEQLLKEREQLKDDLAQKAGEISIVRGNYEKATKEYEREITATKKLNAERFDKQQKAIESAKEAEKKTATELEFLKRDLHEEAEQVKLLKRAIGKEKGATGDPLSTPRKQHVASYRDGFDDDELQIISPSKFPGKRSNAGTPTKAGTKRKRKGPDSPAHALNVSQDEAPVPEQPLPAPLFDVSLLERLQKRDDRIDFLERMLDHRVDESHLKTIEELTKLHFPSNTKESVASIILGKLPELKQDDLPVKDPSVTFPITFSELLISLWDQCLEEQYYKPIYLIVELLTYALILKTSTLGPYIIDRLLRVAQATGDLVAILRFKNESYAKYANDIDVSACLSIMHLAALGCMGEREHIIRFWRLMRIDFVQMILAPNQPVKDIDVMLQLLAMSVTKDSFGPKALDQDSQLEQTSWIINRMSTLLAVSPTVPADTPKYETSVITSLRYQILSTFHAMAQTTYGATALARHTYAIGRLVKLICDSLDDMYDHRSGHLQSARLVNLAMRIMHHLVTTYDREINIQQKLSVIHGGTQKYLIALTRLNFSEDDLVLDSAIEPEVAEAAHDLLELAVTPEEGDAIHSAFSSSS